MMSRTSASLRRSLRSGLIAAPASATGPARRQLLPAAGSPHRVRWLSSDALAGVARVKELQQQVAALVRARDWEAARDAGEECRAALETLTGKRHPGYASALNNLGPSGVCPDPGVSAVGLPAGHVGLRDVCVIICCVGLTHGLTAHAASSPARDRAQLGLQHVRDWADFNPWVRTELRDQYAPRKGEP